MAEEIGKEVYKNAVRTIVYIGEKTYVVFYNATTDYQVSLTGSSETHDFQIPFAFRIELVIVCANDATAKDVKVETISHVMKHLTNPPYLYSVTTDTTLCKIIKCGREYKYPAHTLIRFTLNGTAGKKIFLYAVIQRLGK